MRVGWLAVPPEAALDPSYPEPSVKFHHHVGKFDAFPTADKAANLRATVGPDVVAHKVPVEAVLPALLLVEQDVRRWGEMA